MLAVIGVAVTGLFAFGAASALLTPMPKPMDQGASTFYSANGQVIGSYTPNSRIPIPYGQIPQVMRNAIVASEDTTFWSNFGISPRGLARAAWVDLTHGTVVQGGSTITQQLAKNLFLTQSRTLTRKFLELFLTLRLAATYSKPSILTMYLNTVYFGQGAYGLERAARTYFGIRANQLNLPEAALLAGLVQAPTAYDPYQHPILARQRRAEVLTRMVEVGYITKAQAQVARSAPLELTGATPTAGVAPYFLSYAVATIAQRDPALAHDIEAGGYKVYTTLNLNDQRAADQAVADNMPPNAIEPECALIAINPKNGYIEAMVGGRNYETAPYNRAVYAQRQPGSTFKAFLYSALINTRRYTAASIMDDAPVSFVGVDGKAYRPTNAGGSYRGPIPVRRAISVSDNVVAIKWADIVGPAAIIQVARSLGITSPLNSDLTLALGDSAVSPLEMATAYAGIDNGGVAAKSLAVLKVVDPYGHVVYQDGPSLHRALSPQVAFIVTSLFRSVFSTGGTGQGLDSNLNFEVSGKTGTSSNTNDGWFVGSSSTLTSAVWVGYDTAAPLGGEGATTAGPIWSEFMARAQNPNPPPPFKPPAGVQRVDVSPLDGLLPNATEPSQPEWFIDGTAPQTVSPILYNGPYILYPKNPGQWYYAFHGPNPNQPLWDRLMNFPATPPSPP